MKKIGILTALAAFVVLAGCGGAVSSAVPATHFEGSIATANDRVVVDTLDFYASASQGDWQISSGAFFDADNHTKQPSGGLTGLIGGQGRESRLTLVVKSSQTVYRGKLYYGGKPGYAHPAGGSSNFWEGEMKDGSGNDYIVYVAY